MRTCFDCELCLDPCVQRIDDGRFLVKEHKIGFTDSRGIHWTAPIGLETDGGSIPWIAEPLVGEAIDSDALPAFLLHDQAYQRAPFTETDFWSANQSIFRKAADTMLYEASVVAGVPKWKAALIYHGVRLGGWLPWRLHARRAAGSA
jgi:hypothetical protein